jgi:glycine oxidase
VRLADWPEDRIVVSGVFVLPLGEGLFRVGSTYEWEDLTPVPTDQGRASLLKSLDRLGARVVEVIDHRAAVRPILRGSRPVIGPHPHLRGRWIFNGLGSKGALVAPALAEELADWMCGGACITHEADVGRFFASQRMS